ncbi:MAG: HAMP domain-containing histidine kinase [Gammaproteobacteria bacterium]|nr:HAMP domain-containing histidine kinase [Gammaproteobacteria bacterium]
MDTRFPQKGLSIVMKMSILAGSIAALASFIVGSLIVSGSEDIVYDNALSRLKYETNIKSLRLVSDIKNFSDDAQYLVGTPPIMGIPRAINNNDIDPLDSSHLSEWRDRLATIFSELIRAKPHYLQIRYIGVADNGKEIIRVDRKGNLIRTIQDKDLQRKGDTQYFKNASKINPGEVYLSDITLNREFGEVSEPHTPVIRAATPVYFNERLFGILVINMAFGEIFNKLLKNTPRELTPYVTNEQGYFLAHPDKSMTFGFDFENDNTIQKIYPDFNLHKSHDLRDTEYSMESNGDVVHVVKAHFDPSQDNRFFAVMLATSRQNLQSGYYHLRNESFMIMALLVIISLIVSAILASRLMRPLQLISIASDDLAKGRKIKNLPIDSNDEIGELARSFDDMRHQLEDKERELIISQGHVHHANKMASLGEMASGMAHEINSPIQAINLIAQRVQRQIKNNMSFEDVDNSMQKITTSVNKISEIIDSLRKVSRDSTDEDFRDTRLTDLVQDTLNMTEERFRVNNVKFEVKYHEISENLVIQCQRLQVSQVLINLVNNAYDAIHEMQNKWIKIDMYKISSRIRLSVTDSGPGISEDVIEKIFEPMFTTKDIGKGTGLGLSISRDIIATHNGQFYVDKASRNTCFVLELPIIHTMKIINERNHND